MKQDVLAVPTDRQPTEIEAIARLPESVQIIRLEHETMTALAVAAGPRDHGAMLTELMTQLDKYPAFVRQARYTVPVGKDRQGRMQYASNLSVRAAESIRVAYGNCSIRVEASPIDDDHAKVECVFVDYRTGSIRRDATVVPRMYRGADGTMRRHDPDRFWKVLIPGAKARIERECILRSVPAGLKLELEAQVVKRINLLLDDQTITKLIAAFDAKGVTQEMIERQMGKPIAGLTEEDRSTLMGMWNSLEQKEATVDELFGGSGSESLSPATNRDEQIAALQEKQKKRSAPEPPLAPAKVPRATPKSSRPPEPPPVPVSPEDGYAKMRRELKHAFNGLPLYEVTPTLNAAGIKGITDVDMATPEQLAVIEKAITDTRRKLLTKDKKEKSSADQTTTDN